MAVHPPALKRYLISGVSYATPFAACGGFHAVELLVESPSEPREAISAERFVHLHHGVKRGNE